MWSWGAANTGPGAAYQAYAYTMTITGPVIQPGTTSTSIAAPPASASNPTASATVTVYSPFLSSGAPTGSVTLTVDGTSVGTQPLAPAGAQSSSYTFTFPTPVGVSHTLAATYTPTGTFLASSGTAKLSVLTLIQVSGYPYKNSGTLSSSSYNGNAPDNSLDWNVQGWQQDWYSLPMVAGQTYGFPYGRRTTTPIGTGGVSFRFRIQAAPRFSLAKGKGGIPWRG